MADTLPLNHELSLHFSTNKKLFYSQHGESEVSGNQIVSFITVKLHIVSFFDLQDMYRHVKSTSVV